MTPVTQALLDKVRDAGLLEAETGEPVHVLLARSADLVVANGSAAEPLVRLETQLLIHHAEEVILGLKLAMQATGAKKGIVAVKRSDRDAVQALERAINTDGFAKFHVQIHELPSIYPAGDALTLTTLLEADPAGTLLLNAMTLFQVAGAHRGQRLTRRLVTVTGAVQQPKTLWAPLGASFETLIEAAGGATFEGPAALLVGGPMRGRLADGFAGHVTHTTTNLAVLPQDHVLVRLRRTPRRFALRRAQSTCHACRRCTDLCPVYQAGGALEPHRVMRALHVPFEAPVPVFAATLECTNCQLCTFYACPSELSPASLILEVKAAQSSLGTSVLPRQAGLPGLRAAWRVPLARLAKRLGLYGLDYVAPLEAGEIRVRRIEIELGQGPEVTLHPAVRLGDRVSMGQLVARPAPDSPAVPLYAGIAGVVKSLGETLVIEEIG